MTVNSLSNFGVPGLNGDRAAVLQPIISNRFRVLFFNFGATGEPAPFDLTRQVRRIGRPNVQFDVKPLYSYVSTVYLNTRGEWQELTLVFFDDITNSVMRRVQNQVAKQQNFFDQTMSRAGENYKFEMDLDILAGGQSAGGTAADPNIVQKWCFAGCQIQQDNLGEMNYDNTDPMEIELTIRYDNVIGFDQDGFRMGTFSHNEEIQGQIGVDSTGVGSPVISLGRAASSAISGEVSVDTPFGDVSVGGSVDIAGGNLF